VDAWKEPGGVLRYCLKCGAAALRLIGSKQLYCDYCGFEFYLNPAAAVAALIPDSQGRLLIVERAEEPRKGTWDLPGGFADPGESAEDSLRREVREELGLQITHSRYLCSFPNRYEYMGVRYATMDLGFICDVEDAAVARAAEAEVARILLLRPEEIDISRFGFPSAAQIVERYRTARVR
jgi:ADP-ribose pyrophosphatase YjhB (NUDIX family)